MNKVSYLKLNYKQKVNKKMCTLRDLEKCCHKYLATLFSLILDEIKYMQ